MKQYNVLNRIFAWVVFAVSAVTYILTTEASASYWDCGEFIASANKLLVGHPPGNPFFMIVGRLFTLFAPSPELVAKSVNVMSALCSAFTIFFLFLSITHLARKIFLRNQEGEVEGWRTWAIMGAGVVGSLAYTFSDTFWFSAVEGEVYAMSSLFTAVVFWAILRWEDEADDEHSNRWIILIAYLMGLSIGVHLLNLLAIPAIAMVYYFRKFEVTTRNTIIALAVSGVVLVGILYGIIPGLIKLASWFELFFVNEVGMGYNSGAIFCAVLVVAALVGGIYFSYTKGKALLNTIITAIAVIVIGYSSVAMVVIRSVSNPTMDQNSPEDVFALMDYLNREQYGDRPLFYGQSFASPVDRDKTDYEARPVYVQRDGKYVVVEHRPEYKYQANMLFPRMYSRDQRHIEQYKHWSNFSGRQVSVVGDDGQRTQVTVPTQLENIRFFLSYQCNFMYWRYFMWNFSGRQNDIQGHGEITHGNWITGIDFIDNMMLGCDQSLMPDDLKNNKGRNTYFMLPFLLGLLGLFFQYGRGRAGQQGFWVVMLLFFLTGLAIVMYLNQSPLQPRERDYAYAGSFYAFAIWIGLGVLGAVEALRRLVKNPVVATAVATVVCLLAVPCVMAQQNWDDHDRSGCTMARDMAYNYLNSCEENAVIFTNGDNDTFPLWYIQEVEGVRTDVRVCNLSYLQTGWYVDQMKRRSYESEPLPISFKHEQYTSDRDIVYLLNKVDELPLSKALDFVRDDSEVTKTLQGYKERICYFPTRTFLIPIKSKGVQELDPQRESTEEVKYYEAKINKSYIFKNELMVLDLVDDGTRPLYYATTVGKDSYAGLEELFRLTGLAHRIGLEIPSNKYEKTDVDFDKMYDNVMNKFRWGMFNQGHYLDENKLRMAFTMRLNMMQFVNAGVMMMKIGYKDKVQQSLDVLEKVEEEIPADVVKYEYLGIDVAEAYYNLALYGGFDEAKTNELGLKGNKVIVRAAEECLQDIRFYLSLDDEDFAPLSRECSRQASILNYLIKTLNDRAINFDTVEDVDDAVMDARAEADEMDYVLEAVELHEQLSNELNQISMRLGRYGSK